MEHVSVDVQSATAVQFTHSSCVSLRKNAPLSHAVHCEFPDAVQVTSETHPATGAQAAHARSCVPPQLWLSYSPTSHAALQVAHVPLFKKYPLAQLEHCEFEADVHTTCPSQPVTAVHATHAPLERKKPAAQLAHCESVADVQLTAPAQFATGVQSVHTRSVEPAHAALSNVPAPHAPEHATHESTAPFTR